jgi:hypothetical protein
MKFLVGSRGRMMNLMRRIVEALSCTVAVIVLLALSMGCSGGKAGPGGTGDTTQARKSGELDKLMRTRMNASYSQLVFLVFHSDGEINYTAVEEEGAKLTDAITAVLALQPPRQVQSEQARGIYVDYNNTLKRDNERFVAATAAKDLQTMQSSLTKVGETCSACHHFFRVKVPDAAE